MFKKGLILALSACAVASASAFDVGTLTFVVPPTLSGVNNWIGSLDGHNVGGFAGLLNLNEVDTTNPANSLGPIIALCAQLNTTDMLVTNVNIFNPTSTFGDANTTAAGNIVAGVANLESGNLGLLNNDQAFALQLDVWEAIYDGTAEALPNFSAGRFQTGNTGIASADSLLTASVIADADAFWAFRNVAAPSIFFQANGGGQNMLTSEGGGRRVFTPEPVSSSLGIAAVGLFLRRRKKARAG